MDAMVEAGLPAEPLLAANTLFDIKRTIACSALLVEGGRSATGQPLFARNLDFQTLGYLHEYSLVTIYKPEGKLRFASVTFPGIVGCISGMNEAGLSLAILEVFAASDLSRRFDHDGTPFALCYRRILEECRTIDEAETLLRSMKRTCRTNLALCDPKGCAVFEVTPESVVVRRPERGVLPCTNHFRSEQLAPLVQLNFVRTVERYRTLEHLCRGTARFDLPDLAVAMRDVGFEGNTLQTMVFEPATLRLHVAIGACPSSKEPMRELELRSLLTK
jgi:predicted choloylglycine hydrolase